MSQYTKAGDWCELVSGTTYRTTKSLTWEIGMKGSGLFYTVGVGETFDVSIPEPFWCFFSPHDPRYLKAACIHDHMLIDGWTRVSCGGIFHDALSADGTPALRRVAMWLAVSLFKYNISGKMRSDM